MITGALMTGDARASGDVEPTDGFVTRQSTDIAPDRYDAGDLGVVLVTYPRAYLYTAWRAIVLGRDGLQRAPDAPGGLARSVGGYVEGWVDVNDPLHGLGRWLAQSTAVQSDGRLPAKGVVAAGDRDSRFVNCPQGAFDFATDTLAALQQRADATPQRLATWVRGQDAVFAFCPRGMDRAARRAAAASGVPLPATPAPEALPESEPLYWRQLREYQIAAAAFYAGRFDDSAARFARIGATPGHPMQGWGAYLTLRTALRRASLAQPEQRGDKARADADAAAALRAIEAGAAAILANAQLSVVHEATRATLRAAQSRLQPRARFEALSALLDDPARDPHVDDHLGDWRRLADDLIDHGDSANDAANVSAKEPANESATEATLRQRHTFFDWVRTVQRCANEPKTQCALSRRHALERWRASANAPAQQRAWLVAALLVAERLPVSLEAAALAVPETAPEYLTLRYNLSRLYRAGNDAAKARAVSEGALALVQRSGLPMRSAANLLRSERFAVATSVPDATTYLLRAPTSGPDPDTGEPAADDPRKQPPPQPDLDGLAWLNGRLATTELVGLADDARLDATLRLRLAISAWLRAELLGQTETAGRAALIAERLSPVLGPASRAYRETRSAAERRHALLLVATRLELSTDLAPGRRQPAMALADLARQDPLRDDVVAGMWCRIGQPDPRDDALRDEPGDRTSAVRAPRPLGVSADPARSDRELAALGRVKTSTGVVGDDVMQWARTHPNDPELPWLLYVVIQSTRGGCLDPDSKKLSKAAHTLLHARFERSVWAGKSPYWY